MEDDIYRDLSYDGEPPPPIHALDEAGFVVYISSFSKIVGPGLRLGWVAAPRPLLHQLVMAKQLTDLHAPTLSQLVVGRLVATGVLPRHIGRLREAYVGRRDAMEAALKAEAPDGVWWSRPAGGFYFWCRLPTVSPAALMARAGEERVAYLPGEPCFVHETAEQWVRLSYSLCPAEQIREGVARLMRAVRRTRRPAAARQARMAETQPLV